MVLQRDSFNYYTSLHQHQDQYQYSSLVGERGAFHVSEAYYIREICGRFFKYFCATCKTFPRGQIH